MATMSTIGLVIPLLELSKYGLDNHHASKNLEPFHNLVKYTSELVNLTNQGFSLITADSSPEETAVVRSKLAETRSALQRAKVLVTREIPKPVRKRYFRYIRWISRSSGPAGVVESSDPGNSSIDPIALKASMIHLLNVMSGQLLALEGHHSKRSTHRVSESSRGLRPNMNSGASHVHSRTIPDHHPRRRHIHPSVPIWLLQNTVLEEDM